MGEGLTWGESSRGGGAHVGEGLTWGEGTAVSRQGQLSRCAMRFPDSKVLRTWGSPVTPQQRKENLFNGGTGLFPVLYDLKAALFVESWEGRFPVLQAPGVLPSGLTRELADRFPPGGT